jgi:hypothetical protein
MRGGYVVRKCERGGEARDSSDKDVNLGDVIDGDVVNAIGSDVMSVIGMLLMVMTRYRRVRVQFWD